MSSTALVVCCALTAQVPAASSTQDDLASRYAAQANEAGAAIVANDENALRGSGDVRQNPLYANQPVVRRDGVGGGGAVDPRYGGATGGLPSSLPDSQRPDVAANGVPVGSSQIPRVSDSDGSIVPPTGPTGLQAQQTYPPGSNGVDVTPFSASADAGASRGASSGAYSTGAAQPFSASASAQPIGTIRMSPKRWLQQLMTPSPSSDLMGAELSLAGALSGVTSGSQQTDIVKAYWSLVAACSQYYVAMDLPGHVLITRDRHTGRGGSVSLSVDEYLAESRREVEDAQRVLAGLIGLPANEMPLPTTRPHAGSYISRYDAIFGGRSNAQAVALDRALPLHFELVRARSELLSLVEPGTGEFAVAAEAFLQASRDYNHAIAEYVSLATRGNVRGDDLVPLLIRVESTEQEQVASGDRRVSSVDAPFRRVSPVGGAMRVGPFATERTLLVEPNAIPAGAHANGAVAENGSSATMRSGPQGRVAQGNYQPPSQGAADDSWRRRDGLPAATSQRGW